MAEVKREQAMAKNGAARRRKRHSSRILLYIMLALTAAAVLAALSLSVWFPIDTVRVEGKSSYTAEQIIAAAEIPKGKNLLLANLSGVEAKLRKSLPYIGSAEVSKRLPGTVVIKVTAVTPSFQAAFNGRYLLLDQNYKGLEWVDKPQSGVPVLQGMQLKEQTLGQEITFEVREEKQALDQVVQALQAEEVPQISEIRFSGVYDISLIYENRIMFQLGSASDVNLKLQRAMTIVESMGADKQGVLNLSRLPSDERVYFTQKSITAVNTSNSTQPVIVETTGASQTK